MALLTRILSTPFKPICCKKCLLEFSWYCSWSKLRCGNLLPVRLGGLLMLLLYIDVTAAGPMHTHTMHDRHVHSWEKETETQKQEQHNMPLSPEEKKKRKADKKALKQREDEEMRIKLRKEELAREVRLSKENVANNMKRWYLKNYEARFPHIKQDMEVAWHMFEHTLDVKDFIISEMTDRIQESQVQEAMSWQDYTFKIDDLIRKFLERVDCLDEEYQRSKLQLLEKAHSTSKDQELGQKELEDYYKTVLYTMEQSFADTANATQGEYMTRRDEEAKKGQHAAEVISGALEKTLQTTMGNIRAALEEYRESTEAKRKVVDALRHKDEHFVHMIRRQDSRMAKLCEELSSLQSQVNARYESRLVLDDLKKDREDTYREYTEVRMQLTRDTALADKHLLTLTTESNDVIKDLEHIVEKGEKILRLAALCRKLETQEEKVLPFGVPLEIPGEHQQMGKDTHGTLEHFWKRYANANLIKQKMESTLEALQLENQELRESLETTFEIMSMTQP